MDELSAFERQVGEEILRIVGPAHLVDDLAIFEAAVITPSAKWRIPSMFGATRLAVACAIVALFAGFLLASMSPTSPERQAGPGAATTAAPSAAPIASSSVVPDASDGVPASGRPSYEAIARLVVDPGQEPSVQDLELAASAATRYAGQALSRPVVEAVLAELGLEESVESLFRRVSVEASADTLVLTLRVVDADPAAAQLLATTLAEDMRQRVRDMLVTDEVRKADDAIADAEQSRRTLQARFDQLRRKANKNQLERNEMIILAGQLSGLRQDIQLLRPSSSAFVRNRLDWLERPTLPTLSLPSDLGAPPDAAIPTRDVVVADRPIEQGTRIRPDMLALVTVPMDATNEMAFTDIGSALGKVAAIDILANQPIAPNMLVSE
jgi:flagella basal body P-ring formation protein FlgA